MRAHALGNEAKKHYGWGRGEKGDGKGGGWEWGDDDFATADHPPRAHYVAAATRDPTISGSVMFHSSALGGRESFGF